MASDAAARHPSVVAGPRSLPVLERIVEIVVRFAEEHADVDDSEVQRDDHGRTVVQRCDSGVVERSASRSAPPVSVSAESGHGFGDAASGHEIAHQRSSGERRATWNGHASDEKLLTKGGIALLRRVEIRTVDRWVASGKLRHYRTPSGRLLFSETDARDGQPIAAAGL
jgi:hypothetical protein